MHSGSRRILKQVSYCRENPIFVVDIKVKIPNSRALNCIQIMQRLTKMLGHYHLHKRHRLRESPQLCFWCWTTSWPMSSAMKASTSTESKQSQKPQKFEKEKKVYNLREVEAFLKPCFSWNSHLSLLHKLHIPIQISRISNYYPLFSWFDCGKNELRLQ